MLQIFRSATALAIITLGILSGCASAPNEDLPTVNDNGLQLIKGTKSSALYVLPGADLAQFNRFGISDVRVAFREDWLKDENRSRPLGQRVTQEDADKIKGAIGIQFEKILTEELEKAGYQVVDLEGLDNSSQDLLILKPAIINLDINAPDTMSPGRSRTFTASAGSMTVYAEFYDAVSSSLLAQVMDKETAPDNGVMRISNSITNMAEANRILRKWAGILVKKIDAAHGK